MSYCRVSSDCENGEKSDVYVYGSHDGIVVSVAHNRGLTEEGMKHERARDYTEAWSGKYNIPLNHPEAGAHLLITRRSLAITKLRKLAATGLNVPETAIRRLEEELRDEGDEYS